MPLNKALIPRSVSTYWRFLTGSLFIPTNCLPWPHPNSPFSGSAFGRFSAGWLSDSFGRFNTIVITTAFAVTVVYGTWLPIPFTHSLPLMYFFSAIFGFGSGSIISLAPVCFGQLCKANDYGRYYGTAYSVVSFAYVTLHLVFFPEI
jgi:MFS family permease